jgi:hypothetical protein
MAIDFVDYLAGIVPPRLKTNKLEQYFLVSTGEILNQFADGAAWAVRARFLPDAPPDALGWAGADRVLVRGPNEPDDNWRARLDVVWDAHALAGTVHPDGLLGQLREFGFISDTEEPVLLESQDIYYPTRASWWSRFWVVIPQSCNPYTGAPPTEDQLAVGRIVRQFRPGHVPCARVTLIESGERLIGWPQDGYTIGDAENDGVTFGDSVVHHIELWSEP